MNLAREYGAIVRKDVCWDGSRNLGDNASWIDKDYAIKKEHPLELVIERSQFFRENRITIPQGENVLV